MNKRSVYIVDNEGGSYARMFHNRGWEIVTDMVEADLVQFTGGEDVSPTLYAESKHPRTHANIDRDRHEKLLFKQAQEMGLACAGICRGGQFLNVMNNGKMWQDVDGHANGDHLASVLGNLVLLKVTSTHHQMIIPSVDGIVIMKAGVSTFKERMEEGRVVRRTVDAPQVTVEDVEAVYYPLTNSLCFQPHPEYYNAKDTEQAYFNFLEEYSFGDNTPEPTIVQQEQDDLVIVM